MRVLKSLAVRFVVVFVGCLLLSLVSEHLSNSSQVTVAILDRRYQQTLQTLQGRQSPVQLGDYKEKSGRWSALVNQTLCLMGQENRVALLPCHDTAPLNNWTVHVSRNPDKRDHITLPALNKCVDVGAVTQPAGTPIILYNCHGGVSQELSYDFTSQMIYHGESNNCIEVAEGQVIKFLPCNLKKREQKWHITRTDTAL